LKISRPGDFLRIWNALMPPPKPKPMTARAIMTFVGLCVDQVLQAPAIVIGKALPDSINPGDSFIVMLDLKNAETLRANQLTLSISTSGQGGLIL
jgi:hypothetical protein